MSRRIWLYRPQHPKANERGFVSADDVGFEDSDPRQPVFTDRYMEGARAPDGSDIGSRSKRRMYMRANGVADSSDFSTNYRQQARRSAEKATDRSRRETVARSVYSHFKS